MPTNLPTKKYKGAEALWLFTKAIVFLAMHLLAILSSVVLAVWVGGMAAITTGSKVFGGLAGLAAYMAGMGGRDWLNWLMVRRLFSGKDVKEMDSVIGDIRGPRDP